MDPWNISTNETTDHKHEDKSGCVDDLQNSPIQLLAKFESNFQPSTFNKLPDSDEYLASLEKKLKSVQSGEKNLSSDKILRSLEETRESYMVQLLRNPEILAAEESFDELTVNPILKKLAPEKQAIAQEELIHLVKADQLSLIVESEDSTTTTEEVVPSENNTTSSTE